MKLYFFSETSTGRVFAVILRTEASAAMAFGQKATYIGQEVAIVSPVILDEGMDCPSIEPQDVIIVLPPNLRSPWVEVPWVSWKMAEADMRSFTMEVASLDVWGPSVQVVCAGQCGGTHAPASPCFGLATPVRRPAYGLKLSIESDEVDDVVMDHLSRDAFDAFMAENMRHVSIKLIYKVVFIASGMFRLKVYFSTKKHDG